MDSTRLDGGAMGRIGAAKKHNHHGSYAHSVTTLPGIAEEVSYHRADTTPNTERVLHPLSSDSYLADGEIANTVAANDQYHQDHPNQDITPEIYPSRGGSMSAYDTGSAHAMDGVSEQWNMYTKRREQNLPTDQLFLAAEAARNFQNVKNRNFVVSSLG
jgi:hypothetical protein